MVNTFPWSTITVTIHISLFLINLTAAFESRPRFLILPGFGNDAIDYSNPLNRGTGFGFVNSLTSRGFEVDVVPIKRVQWLNILSAVASVDFWKSTCKPSNLFSFYFKAVDKSVREMNERSPQPIILLGHSAGGWLARGILGDGAWASSSTPSSDLVAGLVTLGAPHLPPVEGAPDMTRGALRYVDTSFPGAYLSAGKGRNIFYVTVAGTAVFGDRVAPEGSINRFASNSYQQVTGSGPDSDEVVGDGVVPLSHAHLTGAEQITLQDCFHSIQSDSWYGGDGVIDRWLPQTLSALERTLELRAQERCSGDLI
jgi:pimeloyl-ACP methyl ester carboxylesterase